MANSNHPDIGRIVYYSAVTSHHYTTKDGRGYRRFHPILLNEEKRGIFLGITTKYEGKVTGSKYYGPGDYENGYLEVEKSVTMYVVQPLGSGKRYSRPVWCFPVHVRVGD